MPDAVPTVMALAGVSAATDRTIEAAVSESKTRRIDNPSVTFVRALHRVVLQERERTKADTNKRKHEKAGRLRGRLAIM